MCSWRDGLCLSACNLDDPWIWHGSFWCKMMKCPVQVFTEVSEAHEKLAMLNKTFIRLTMTLFLLAHSKTIHLYWNIVCRLVIYPLRGCQQTRYFSESDYLTRPPPTWAVLWKPFSLIFFSLWSANVLVGNLFRYLSWKTGFAMYLSKHCSIIGWRKIAENTNGCSINLRLEL